MTPEKDPNRQPSDVWPGKYHGRPDAENDCKVPNPPAPHGSKYTAQQEADVRPGG